MSKKKNLNIINGWLNIYKPKGITSNQAIGKIKRILSPAKIGHAGTLDPEAFGILPIALGEATKTIQFTQDKKKTYLFEVTWGEERNTDDVEGEVIQTSNTRPTQSDIEKIIPNFIGEIEQVPPKFSAIKIDGQRAYKLSRDGEDIEMPSRIVSVHNLKLIDSTANSARFEMECGKGTYVRSVGRDMGRILGCFGYISSLERTKVGVFDKSSSILLDKLEENIISSGRDLLVLPVETVLDDIPDLALADSEVERISHGQSIILPDSLAYLENNDIVLGLKGKTPLALLARIDAELKPMRLFNL